MKRKKFTELYEEEEVVGRRGKEERKRLKEIGRDGEGIAVATEDISITTHTQLCPQAIPTEDAWSSTPIATSNSSRESSRLRSIMILPFPKVRFIQRQSGGCSISRWGVPVTFSWTDYATGAVLVSLSREVARHFLSLVGLSLG